MSCPFSDNGYWPNELRTFGETDPTAQEMVTVAEITKPFDQDSGLQLFSAIVPVDVAEKILNEPLSLSWPMDTSGPHPMNIPSDKPWFRLGSDKTPLEPLVISWEEAGHRVLLPDQGFLMTYGLVPRVLKSENNDLMAWDDLSIPQYDVIQVKSTSKFHYTLLTPAYVRIHRAYLQDYATSRDMAIIQLYFIHSDIEESEEIKSILGKQNSVEKNLAGRNLVVARNTMTGTAYCQVWGVRRLFNPGPSPIIQDSFHVEDLEWPGISGVVTKQNYDGFGLQRIYVRDTVLAEYEKRPDVYSIDPESGAISLGTIWGVGYCHRIGRDIIAVELEKLYEGSPQHVIKHWHRHAIDSPDMTDQTIQNAPNVATRSLRIAESAFELGNLISEIERIATGSSTLPVEIIGYDEPQLKYKGIWSNPYLQRIVRHIATDIGQDTFFQRCIDLENAIIEGLKESYFRHLLINMGIDSDSIKNLRSLKLVYVLVAYAQIANNTGLDIVGDFAEIDKRRQETNPNLKEGPYINTPVTRLFMLHEFRIGGAHRGRLVQGLLEKYNIDRASLKAGWGLLLDQLYDDLGGALEEINKTLRRALEDHKDT